ncbi:hypothetical protein O6H91_17G065700 [Diphasiastrum complanatum]|uniref:Uncharacterized protein n=1 Tax=Diphasiastrum complanatum TaxID=34168 RepID=A0ACC2B7Q5_DIPCM|nr:hypothetical protein O6H91_17G065700 [Diphasiastrum complanatum]
MLIWLVVYGRMEQESHGALCTCIHIKLKIADTNRNGMVSVRQPQQMPWPSRAHAIRVNILRLAWTLRAMPCCLNWPAAWLYCVGGTMKGTVLVDAAQKSLSKAVLFATAHDQCK